MLGTIVFFFVLFSLFFVLYLYGREDVMDTLEHKRSKLNMKKDYYMEIGKYSKEPKGIPINKSGRVVFNPRFNRWE
jgi:hypothetical protein